MSIEATLFIGSQLLMILMLSVIGLVAVGYRRRALQREMAAMGAEKLSLEAYQRFIAARNRILLAMRRVDAIILVIIVLGSVVAISFIDRFDFFLANNLDFEQKILIVVLLLLAFVIGFYVGAYVHDIVGAVVVDVEALRLSQMSSLQRSEVLILKIKTALLKPLPLILYFEALGGIILFDGNVYFALFASLFIAVSAVIVNYVFAVPLYAWTTPMHPIEQTEWASLAPRIAAWEKLAGVAFASVYVQQDLVGTVNVRTIGLGRPTLVLSETFLRYSEWRQQDAMICMVFGLVRKHVSRNIFLSTLLTYVLIATFVAAIPFLFRFVLNIYWLLFLLIVFYYLLFMLRGGFWPFVRSVYFDIDRIAASLTGDPGAIMVVLNTINALNGTSAMQRPSVRERVQRLSARDWPHAPQARMLVPAITVVSFGSYNLTTLLDQATSPEPVPSAPYASLV